jgi:putative holliday junction resolvase
MQDFDLEPQEPKIIKTQDENGEIHNFELIDVINVDEQEYGLLIHLDEDEKHCACGCECTDEEDEEDEVIIMRLSKQDDAYTFESIENDEEFDRVVNYLENESDFIFEDDEEEEEKEEE